MFSRTRAPELTGRGWLNTGGKSLSLQDLRGKIVLLDFWTFCCINCLHVLDELRPLEEKYADVLVTVGVHSPKFEHEKDAVALAAAVERYGVTHPVLDDPEMSTWRQYGARAWPTLCVIDPEGYVVAALSGEGHANGLATLFDKLIDTHDAKGNLRRGDSPYVEVPIEETALRFPGKAVVTPAGTFLVSSSAQHQLVELASDGETVIRRIGTGERGRTDGSASQVQFSEPQGMCFLPPDVVDAVGYDVVVADTVNHLLRGLRLRDGQVSTLAGTGVQRHAAPPIGAANALDIEMSSPWDVAWFDNVVVVAMAGVHQLWWFDPRNNTTGVYAGAGPESLRDGPVLSSYMAQPSGLSVQGDRLWVADSETSALRWVESDQIHTAVGQGLFDFGLMDGAGREALLQHPLGLCALEDGSVLIADTYNGAVRFYDFENDHVTTVTTGLAEPSDIVVTPTGDVIVVESAAHRLTRLAPGQLEAAGVHPDGQRHRIVRPETLIAPGKFELDIVFTPAEGQKLDDSFGPPVHLSISSSPASLLVEGAGQSDELSRTLMIADNIESGVLGVDIRIATCDADAEFPACHLAEQSWGIPVRVSPEGLTRLPLMFRGEDGPEGS